MKIILNTLSFRGKLDYLSKKLENDYLHLDNDSKVELNDRIQYFQDMANVFLGLVEYEQNASRLDKATVGKLLGHITNNRKVAAISVLRQAYYDRGDHVGLKETKGEIERVYSFEREKWFVKSWEFRGLIICDEISNE